MSTTFDLSTLGLPEGTHSITVKARASGYEDSDESNAVSYVNKEIFRQVYPTVSADNTTVLSNMDTSKKYTIFSGPEDDYGAPDLETFELFYIAYENGQWCSYLLSDGRFVIEDQDNDPSVDIYSPTSTSIVFEIFGSENNVWYGATLEGNTFATEEDFSSCEWQQVYRTYMCFAEGTLITLADGSTKAVEDITYDDELLVWNFYEGEYATAKPFWIMIPDVASYYYKITLSNGNIINLIGSNGDCHRVFSVTKNKFEYATRCVGDEIYTEDGIFKMLSCERVNETVRYYNLKTEKYHNCFANGILTCGRHGNMYDIADMKYCSDIPNFTEAELAEREARWETKRLPR